MAMDTAKIRWLRNEFSHALSRDAVFASLPGMSRQLMQESLSWMVEKEKFRTELHKVQETSNAVFRMKLTAPVCGEEISLKISVDTAGFEKIIQD